MTAEEKRLYTRYFYNSVIEFIYFIILYIETYGIASLNVLSKHIKFFKIEVSNLISLFEGKTSEDKLCQMLKTLECFLIFEDEIKINENVNLKDIIFEELVLSKCVDLLLKGVNNIHDLCENLNYNSVIRISKQNLLHIIENYSFMSVNKNQTVTLHHVHGLFGFEDHLCNSVIGYFHNFLYHGKILSIKEIRNHSKSLTFCGVSNILGIFSILNCSRQFDCQNGYMLLKKKSKKYPKKKPLHMEVMEANFSSRSLPIGQVVYSTYGSFLHQWSGEIGTLTESSGVIYCVVDFTNGHQGVFNIYFNKAALKVISEINNLKKYLNVRDVVEFDAEYYSGKKLDRCWKATRVKLLSSNKFQYDELLSGKLSYDSELQRNKCTNNMCCSKINLTMNCIENDSLNAKDTKYHNTQLSEGKGKTTDYELCSLSNSVNKMETVDVLNEYTSQNQELSNNSFTPVSNTLILDYLFMFGRVYLLMEDKGVAIAEHEGKFYNILFMKDSIYPPNKLEHFFLKYQKVLAFIPYLGKLESFCVATLMYGLNEEETKETEKIDIPPEEFAVKTFLLNTIKNLCFNFCNNCNFLNGLQTVKFENFDRDLKYKMQLTELYDFITRQYEVPFINNQLLLLLHSICTENFNGEKFSSKIFHFIIKLSKCLTKCTNQEKIKVKNKRKLKRVHINNESDAQINIQLQELCTKVLRKSITGENCMSESNLTVKSNSLDVIKGSLNLKRVSINHKSDSQINVQPQELCTKELRKTVTDENGISYSNLTLKSNSLDAIEGRLSLKRVGINHKSDSQINVQPQELCIKELKKPVTDENGISYSNLSVKSNSLDVMKGSLSSLNSYKTCSTDSFDIFYSCESNCNTPKYLSNSSLNGSLIVTTCNESLPCETGAVTGFDLTIPLPTILNEKCNILSINSSQNFKMKTQQNFKNSKCHKYLSLQSVPSLKCSVKKKKRVIFPYTLKPPCKNCVRNSLKITASISLISNSFFFFTTNIDGHSIVLPLPKQDIPSDLQRKLKLNSCGEITVIPSILVNLSHIMAARIIT